MFVFNDIFEQGEVRPPPLLSTGSGAVQKRSLKSAGVQILSPYRISLCILIHESNVARRLNKIDATSSDSVSQYLLAKINVR
jgi:hypothetical protein